MTSVTRAYAAAARIVGAIEGLARRARAFNPSQPFPPGTTGHELGHNEFRARHRWPRLPDEWEEWGGLFADAVIASMELDDLLTEEVRGAARRVHAIDAAPIQLGARGLTRKRCWIDAAAELGHHLREHVVYRGRAIPHSRDPAVVLADWKQLPTSEAEVSVATLRYDGLDFADVRGQLKRERQEVIEHEAKASGTASDPDRPTGGTTTRWYGGQHPAHALRDALNQLHTACWNADRFRELAADRQRAMDQHGHLLRLANEAANRETDPGRAKSLRAEAMALFDRGPSYNETPGRLDRLLAILSTGRLWIDRASEALRDWTDIAESLDKALGEPRSIEIGRKLREADRTFAGLQVGLALPGSKLEAGADAMTELGDWLGRTHDELGAFLETRRLALPPALGSTLHVPGVGDAGSPPRPEREAVASTNRTATDAPSPARLGDDAMLSPAGLLRAFNLPADQLNALRGRLKRYRKHNHSGWIENQEASGREAKYLYRLGSIKGVVEALRATSNATSERPPSDDGAG